MVRNSRQQGASLIFVLGIVATLALLASSMVAVIANAQHNAMHERTRAQSFNVAEAALDAAMSNVALSWPTSTPVPFPTTSFQDQFEPQSGALPEYPATTGSVVPDVTVAYFDNVDTNGDGVIDANDAQVDSNRDDKMYIVTQALVLGSSSRVLALVQRSSFEPQIPSTDVLWCGGDVLVSGGGLGVMPKVTLGNANPLAVGGVSVDVLGNIEYYDQGLIDTSKIDVQFSSGPAGHNQPKTLEETFPQSARAAIISYAKLVGRYFDANNATKGMTPLQTAQASPKSTYGGPGMAGLTVIDQSFGSCDIRDPVNSETSPGILILLGGISLDIGGNADFYGLIFVQDGTITFSHGTPTVHGAVYGTRDITFAGTCNLSFDYIAMSAFASRTLDYNVTMVPNTWRELKPR